jgi:hypothetical protein
MTFFHQITAAAFRFAPSPPPVLNLVTYSAEGGSLEFSSNALGFVQYPTSDDWSLGTGDYTIEWWQWLTQDAQFPRPFSVGSFPSAKVAVSIEGGTFYVWHMNGVRLSVGLLDYEEQWVHFAVSREMGALRVFQNGVQISQTTNNSDIQADGQTLTIGNESNANTAGGFTGYLTNFRWTKGEALYTSNFTVPNQVLGAGENTKLLLLASSSINDVVDSTDQHVASNRNVSWLRVGPYSQRAWLDAGDVNSYPGSGNTWGDLSGFDNDLTLANTTFGLLQGGYIDFGLTGSGQFNASPATITANKTPSASMTMWANIQQTSNFNFVAGLRGGTNYGFWFLMLDGQNLTEARVVTDTGLYDINVDFTNRYATWCHICFTVNNNLSQLYINGVLAGSNSTVSGTWGTPPPEFRLASETGGNNQSENLRMATFRYHTRARTAAEILAEFNAERSRFGV